ncbi:hypothetical protein JRO89_XS05G0002700 [Xanthoceras sorbifolium]|uniref:Large ribosomal RNA subunit accumulation protein YCED homolog 1, chloroplastic n=1 Tax=Xanthoceras sorbifolium TaxID=99658 RepID=A0ABQ8HZL0_9ROSI|nr:hypothetical protein JRO89_XS05G0002700 [Xanthoceras sorbifolium]
MLSSCSVANQFKPYNLKPQVTGSANITSSFLRCKVRPFSSYCSIKSMYKLFSSRRRRPPSYISNACVSDDDTNSTIQSLEWEDLDEDTGGGGGSPWEGAVIYKRNASVTHVEYCTTLERLGLGNVSNEISKSRASTMGLRVTKAVKDFPQGTPVLVSIDVTRKKGKLRLDGIVRTVIALDCNRCCQPAAESVFSNISLLLSEQPIEEPEILDMGVMFGKDNLSIGSKEEEDDDEASIDWDDQLYFPLEEKEIDISKNIRDLVHVEITMNAICDPKCKGICLNCGTNLNKDKCDCSTEDEEVKERSYGPLGNLRRQMERK